MRYLLKFLKAIDAINEWIGRTFSYLVFLVAFITVYTVITRYIFKKSPLWGLESAQYLFTVVVMLMAGYVLLHDGHVKNDLLYTHLSPRIRSLVDLFTGIFFFFYAGSLLWKGWSFFWTSMMLKETTGSLWGPPVYPIKGLVLAGFLLLMLQGITKFIRDLFIVFSMGGKE